MHLVLPPSSVAMLEAVLEHVNGHPAKSREGRTST